MQDSVIPSDKSHIRGSNKKEDATCLKTLLTRRIVALGLDMHVSVAARNETEPTIVFPPQSCVWYDI